VLICSERKVPVTSGGSAHLYAVNQWDVFLVTSIVTDVSYS
jgi:hypothetical protein